MAIQNANGPRNALFVPEVSIMIMCIDACCMFLPYYLCFYKIEPISDLVVYSHIGVRSHFKFWLEDKYIVC